VAVSSETPNPTAPVTVTAGACPVGGNTRLAVGWMVFNGVYTGGGSGGTVGGGFTMRRQTSPSFLGPTSGTWMVWVDDTSTGVSSEPAVETPAFTAGGVSPELAHVTWLAVNAAFRYGV
jgi:hypothetical protein